jgi:hypothetical protein
MPRVRFAPPVGRGQFWAAKLYSAPGSAHFGRRKCMGLTYESCRDSRLKAGLRAELQRSR